MRTLLITMFASVLLLGASPTIASGSEGRVSIPFATIGNIRNWHSDSKDELYVQNMHKQWYRVTFWSPCTELPFAVGIAFVTDTLGSLDRFSSILVDGQRCWFRTFEKSDEPVGLKHDAKAKDGQDKGE